MAVYPEGNPGVYPINASTDVGQMRYLLGDTESTAYDPVEAGYQNYEFFSDAELQALLTMAGDSIPTAVGYAYLKLAGAAAGQSVEWQSDDLRVSLSKTPGELRQIAQMWFDQGSSEAGNIDIFELVNVNSCTCPCHNYEFAWGQCEYGCRCSW